MILLFIQQHEHLSDLQNEVSLLETKYKRADEEVECKKQVGNRYGVYLMIIKDNFAYFFFFI